MPKRSELEAQMAALQAELDKADTDDEIWVKDDNGREIKISGRRATSVLKRLGMHDITDGDEPAEGEPAEGDGDPEADPDPEPAGGYFGRRRK